MTRLTEKSEMDEVIRRADAEDRALRYLNRFSHQVAAEIAMRAMCTLAFRWKAQQDEMIRRQDPRKMICISDTEMQSVRRLLATVPQGTPSEVVAEQHIIGLLAEFQPDRAWWSSHHLARSTTFLTRSWTPL